jgi:hypothetical protein
VKAFKKSVKDHGMDTQDKKCVWCEAKIGKSGRRTAHRDHIAPKHIYEQWTFVPKNIAMSCEFCNGFEIKKDLDTINLSAAVYEDCTFLIVHPYIDDPDEHIGYDEGNDPVLMVGLSDKGLWTIEKMELDGTAATGRRAIDKVFKDIGLPEQDEERLRQVMEHLG